MFQVGFPYELQRKKKIVKRIFFIKINEIKYYTYLYATLYILVKLSKLKIK